jgi:hypothetical protein
MADDVSEILAGSIFKSSEKIVTILPPTGYSGYIVTVVIRAIGIR